MLYKCVRLFMFSLYIHIVIYSFPLVHNMSVCSGYYNPAYRMCWPPELAGSVTYNHCPNYTNKALKKDMQRIHVTCEYIVR